jgi:hypothetical protein
MKDLRINIENPNKSIKTSLFDLLEKKNEVSKQTIGPVTCKTSEIRKTKNFKFLNTSINSRFKNNKRKF